ncbi:hypothetical protein [Agromyces sp. GXS1127]|uniref:hypothetical protein n=1 Tax=Agromyces sp. GXS1127 TaxID=3424181 RepID=UPI003D31437D
MPDWRRFLDRYLQLRNYTETVRRAGFSDTDFTDGGSDRLVDTIVAHGTIDELADRTWAHWDAGADHVSVNVQPDTEDPVPTLRALAAPALER